MPDPKKYKDFINAANIKEEKVEKEVPYPQRDESNTPTI